MFIFRPIQKSDLDSLMEMAEQVEPGLTTLPKNKHYLGRKIDDSERAFNPNVHKPGQESYLFVLEDNLTGRIAGTSGIIAKTGGFEPFYTYEIKNEHHEDHKLGVKKDISSLHLVANHAGPSEICSLFIKKEFRKGGLGRLLSRARFLFMSEFNERFEDEVISELRGVSDSKGNSPFWEHVGRHFFDTDFITADFLSGLGDKEFIKNLMPKYPIYIPMLPKEVQAVIGKVHANTEPALHLLLKEGFEHTNEVDIFDGGPTVRAKLKNIKTIQNSTKVKIKKITWNNTDSADCMVSNTSLNFKACYGQCQIDKGEAILHKDVAKALDLNAGDEIRVMQFV